MKKIYLKFISECPIKVARGVKLSRFCTMKVGGPADLFVEAKTPSELIEVLRIAIKLGIKYFVLASGSNVVFPDAGWRGLVIHYTANSIKIERKKMVAEVEAGAKLNYVVMHLVDLGLGGFNFLANIPGSVGGAIVGNAGCYGKEIKDFLRTIQIYNVKTNEVSTIKPKELDFAYRHSKLKERPELIVLSAVFKLGKINKKQALKEIAEEKQLRWRKHPHAPSCGSWFKNPERGVPAWKFIEAAGMRGATIGGARISCKHSNFLINCGGATATDVAKLSLFVKRKVGSQTGINLMEEVKIVS